MNEVLRVGVVGLGFIGELHARILSELPNATLVAVSDINRQVAEDVSRKYSCEFYTDYRVMFEKTEIDAVCICTPDEYHAEIAICASENGLNILLEKPIAKTEEESLKIIQAVEKAGVRLMVAHILKFDPRYVQLKEAIDRNELGDIIHMYFRRTNPITNGRRLKGKVSIFYFIGVHDFEMMCTYAKTRPIKAYSQMVSKLNKDIGCEDSVFSVINFEDGSIGTVELCWALPDNTALGINTYAEVVGTKGVGYVNILDQGVSVITDSKVYYPDTLHWPEYNGQILGDLREEILHFVTATLENKPYLVDTNNAVTAVKTIEACFKSIETGLPVDIHYEP